MSKKDPLITIITVNFNDKVGLERTIKNVANQTWKKFEYIIIDGGSSDGSKDIIEKYKDNFDYWVSEPDKGIYNAMNKAIERANGTYLLFLNSGDEFDSLNILEESHDLIHTEDLIYFDVNLVFPDAIKEHKFPKELNYDVLLKGTICHQTTFIKKTLFDKVGLYDESLRIVADWKFFSQSVIHFGCSSKKVNKILAKYYMDGISSINTEELQRERELVIKKHFSDYLRLTKLELFVDELKMSRLIKIAQKMGFMKIMRKL